MANASTPRIERVMSKSNFRSAQEHFMHSIGEDTIKSLDREVFVSLYAAPYAHREEFKSEAKRLIVHYLHIEARAEYITPELVAKAKELIESPGNRKKADKVDRRMREKAAEALQDA